MTPDKQFYESMIKKCKLSLKNAPCPEFLHERIRYYQTKLNEMNKQETLKLEVMKNETK